MRISFFFILLSLCASFSLLRADEAPPASAIRMKVTSTPCQIEAFVIDPDPKGLNVRLNPDPHSLVVGKLVKGGSGIAVAVIADAGNKWLKIEGSESPDNDAKKLFQGEGWVYAPMLALTIRARGTGNSAPAYDHFKGKPIGKIPNETQVKLAGCREGWAQILFQGREVWLPEDRQCGNPVTTCP